MSRVNPYIALLTDIKEYCWKVMYPKTIDMWHYPKKRLDEGWTLADLYERTAAAEQLGYDVILKATDEGLEVKYQTKRPETPWQWK